tara:strand:- start:298 stop:474 length:177 start_codon:yes stop_codon:yes gene_type:complete
MNKENLKVLINDLERAVAELKAEVYSDKTSYLTYEDYKKLRDENDPSLDYSQIFEDDE